MKHGPGIQVQDGFQAVNDLTMMVNQGKTKTHYEDQLRPYMTSFG